MRDRYNEYYKWFMLVNPLETEGGKILPYGTIFLLDVLNGTFHPICEQGQENIFIKVPKSLISVFSLFQEIKLPTDVKSFISNGKKFEVTRNPYLYRSLDNDEVFLPFAVISDKFNVYEKVLFTHEAHHMGEICFN